MWIDMKMTRYDLNKNNNHINHGDVKVNDDVDVAEDDDAADNNK